MDRGLYNIVVLLDLKKAFDTVNHEILLSTVSLNDLALVKKPWRYIVTT